MEWDWTTRHRARWKAFACKHCGGEWYVKGPCGEVYCTDCQYQRPWPPETWRQRLRLAAAESSYRALLFIFLFFSGLAHVCKAAFFREGRTGEKPGDGMVDVLGNGPLSKEQEAELDRILAEEDEAEAKEGEKRSERGGKP